MLLCVLWSLCRQGPLGTPESKHWRFPDSGIFQFSPPQQVMSFSVNPLFSYTVRLFVASKFWFATYARSLSVPLFRVSWWADEHRYAGHMNYGWYLAGEFMFFLFLSSCIGSLLHESQHSDELTACWRLLFAFCRSCIVKFYSLPFRTAQAMICLSTLFNTCLEARTLPWNRYTHLCSVSFCFCWAS